MSRHRRRGHRLDEGRAGKAKLSSERRCAGAGFGGAADEQERRGSIIIKNLNWRATTYEHPAYPRRYIPHRSFPINRPTERPSLVRPSLTPILMMIVLPSSSSASASKPNTNTTREQATEDQ
jgi:hypothetical protein